VKITILNTSILTNFGQFEFTKIDLDNAKTIIQEADEVVSAVGHQATAEILTELLGINIPMNRIQYSQTPGDSALVFKINGRIPEGKILSREDIDQIGFQFGLLTQLA
jgi:hypothetical protein